MKIIKEKIKIQNHKLLYILYFKYILNIFNYLY